MTVVQQCILNTFQIIFKDYRCKACGVEGDHRLLPLFCHMEKESVHPGGYAKTHSQSMHYHEQGCGIPWGVR